MLKALRWPLLALLFSIILLGVALFIRYGEEDNEPRPDDTPLIQSTITDSSPGITPTPNATPIPTVSVASDFSEPISGQLTEALVGNISKLNPLFASFNPVDRDITSLIFEGLTSINEFGEVIPLLAERWDVSRDGLEYIFLLRRDILWQDGIPFTSADVRYTINTLRDPDFPGDLSLTAFWRTVEMNVIDEYTIRFRLVQPLASFPEQLRIGMLPAHALEGYPVAELDRHPFNLSPIGTGPYQREALYAVNGQLAISVRVAPTYRQRPEGQNGFAIDRIVFRTYPTYEQATVALARGDVNSIGSLPVERLASLNSLTSLAVHTSLEPVVGVLIYNWRRDDIQYMQNQRARLAFARGIDRVTAIERTMAVVAMPAQSPLIPGSWAYDSTAILPAYDPDLARSVLDSVAFEVEIPAAEESPEADTEETETEGEATTETEAEPATLALRREFSILVINDPTRAALAEDIAVQWGQLGFTVSVEAVDEMAYLQRLMDGDFDTAIVEYSYAPYADPDPYAFWHVSQYEDGVNYGGMRDVRISEVIERGRREPVGINRVLLYQEFQQLFADRVPALTLYHPIYAYVVDRRLEGVQLGYITTPADRFRTIKDWQWVLE